MKSVIGALAAAAAVGVAFAMSGASSAATFDFTVEAMGSNEVPSVSGPGSAIGEFTFDDETNELEYSLTVDGLSEDEVTAAHIHRGAEGENGPIAYTLSSEGFTEIDGTVELSDADVEALMDGELYLNVHSVDNPDGFARGQLELPAEATDDDEGTPESSATPSATTTTPSGSATPQTTPTSEVAGQVDPPSTGDGGLAAGGQGSSTLSYAVLLSAVALGSSAIVLARRRN